MSVHRDLSQLAEDAVRLLAPTEVRAGRLEPLVDATVDAMEEAQRGQPGAQRFDPVRAGGYTELWCDEHECVAEKCWEADRLCSGETIRIVDPTGEAAIAPDSARADLRAFQRDIESAKRALERASLRAMKYQKNRVTNDRAGIGECDTCHRYVDGQKDRLRPVDSLRLCNACRMRQIRGRAS